MEVILLQRVEKLGAIGEVVAVKDGYARNFLIPNGVALRATAKNKEEFEAKKAEIEAQNEEKKTEAAKLAEKLEGRFFVLLMQSGEDGRLFGSVTARNIASLVNESGAIDGTVSHKVVRTSASIKYIGVYVVKLVLHPDVVVSINVNVARSETEAVEAEQAFVRGETTKEKADSSASVELAVEEGSSEESEDDSSDKDNEAA